MQLSDTEKKMLARLQKRKQTFARWRWLLLLTSVFSIGVGIYCMIILQQCFQQDSGAVILALTIPIVYLFLGIGTWIMTDTLVNWHGKPEVDLLLRLIEESQDEPPNKSS